MPDPETSGAPVLTVADVGFGALRSLLKRFDFELAAVADGEKISGSFWGEPEAGVIGSCVYVRNDTPVHSLLHETSHLVCMNRERRRVVHTDAGGDDLEESAVCYLQIVLADSIDGVGRARLMQDMDSWGYSFRLGSTGNWFQKDAADAREWLQQQGLLGGDGAPTFAVRM